MADVQFVRENPFINSFARDQERQDIEATRGQERAARDQSMQATAQQMQSNQENQAELRRQRTQTQAVDRAYGDAAVARVAPVLPVARPQAGPVQPIEGKTGLDAMPAGLPDRMDATNARPAAPSAPFVNILARTPGGGKAAYDAANTSEQQQNALHEKLWKDFHSSQTLEEARFNANRLKSANVAIPDEVVNNNGKLAELVNIAKATAHLPEDQRGEAMRPALTALNINIGPARSKVAKWDRDPGSSTLTGYSADGRVLVTQPGTRAPDKPHWVKTENGDLVDATTGDVQHYNPGSLAVKGTWHAIGPNDPDTPAVPAGWQRTPGPGRSGAPAGQPGQASAAQVPAAIQARVQQAMQQGATPQELAQELRAKGYGDDVIGAMLGAKPPTSSVQNPFTPQPGAGGGGAQPPGRPPVAAPAAAPRPAPQNVDWNAIPEPPAPTAKRDEFDAWDKKWSALYAQKQERIKQMVDSGYRADQSASAGRASSASLSAQLRDRQKAGLD